MTIEIKVVETTALGSSTEVTTVDGLMIGLTQFNGRNGAVQPAAGDYTAAQVTSTSNATVQADLDALRGSATNVDNTSDADKPISTATQEALDLASLISAASSKADMEFNAEQNKRAYAGSGNVEWGKHRAQNDTSYGEAINNGIWAYVRSPNQLRLGWTGASDKGMGLSKSVFPIINVVGVLHNVNPSENIENSFTVKFPPAPDGTKTYDTATGVTTTHATSNEAFEGLVTNGDFRNGTIGWASVSSQTPTVIDGVVNIIATATHPSIGNIVNVVAGKSYNIVFSGCSTTSSNGYRIIIGTSTGSGGLYVGDTNFDSTKSHTYTALTTEAIFIGIQGNTVSVGDTISLSSVSILPSTESVVTSRKDLVFLETFHEVISSNAGADGHQDIVCPLGNVQFGATTYSGIATINTPTQGYSAFGEWDTITRGKVATWSTLSTANKLIYISDPDNNIYYDESIKQFVQIRYRIRVIEGLGDNWANVLPTDNEYLQYDTNGNYVAPQGSSTTAVDFNPSYPVFVSTNKPDAALEHDNYIFGSVGGSSVKFGNAYNGKCFAVPIALVQRLNQGAYHPTYNSTGTGKQINTATNGFVFWDGVNAKAVTSTAMTFAAFDNGGVKDANSPANVGSINGASALSGSPSQYEFYDAIYAGQVKDLRLDANKKDLSKLLEDSSRSDIAATTRGWGKVPFTKFTRTSDAKLSIVDTSGAGTYVRIEDNSGTQLSASALISNTDDEDYTPTRINTYIYNATKNIVMYIGHISAGSNAFYIHTHPQFNTRYSGVGKYPVAPSAIDVGDDVMVCDMPFELTAEYDKLPWVDIIGSPANIAVTFPTGCVGQWIPEFPDGGAKTFNLNRKSDIVTGIITHKTTGNWLSENVSIDPTTNTITKFMATNQIGLIYYDSLSDFTAPAAHTAIVGDVRNVFVGCCSSPNLGNRLAPSLMIKVATSHDSSLRISNVVMEKYGMESSGELRTDTSVNFHATHDLIAPTNNSIGFKTLFTVVAVDGLYYLQYNGSELAYTSTSFSEWGDDETIQITDNDSTQLDTNDVTVANFCHHSLIPIGIAHN